MRQHGALWHPGRATGVLEDRGVLGADVDRAEGGVAAQEVSEGSLARFKIPAEIEFRSDLPKSAVGKVLRRALADEDQASRVMNETAGRQQ